MLKKLITGMLFFTSLSSFAAISLGEYRLGDCDVSVREGWRPNEIEVRVDKNNQYGKMVIDKNTLQIYSINTCNDKLSSEKANVSSKRIDNQEITIVTADCGGTWKSTKASVAAEFSKSTGELDIFRIKAEVAKMGLPNGMHSGPIKEVTADFLCR